MTLDTSSLPSVATSVGPNACMFELLGLENNADSCSKTLLNKRLCFLENSLILDKNVVACLRVSYDDLCVLFQSLLSMGLRSFANQTYPQISIDACDGSVSFE